MGTEGTERAVMAIPSGERVGLRRVAVVGGGISGLATAFLLQEEARTHGVAVELDLFEAGERVGGNIRSEAADGYLVEWGPDGFLDNAPRTLELVKALDLDGELVRASEAAARRFIWRGGRLHPLPTGPLGLLRSGILSLPGRLRVFAEPFQPAGPVEEDESVRDFGVRRIGREAADTLIDAMVSGVFAGDAARLSLPSAFPRMWAMERRYGSLVRAMLALRRERRREAAGGASPKAPAGGAAGPGGTLHSFVRGMETLPATLAERLGKRVHTGAAVRHVVREEDGAWTLAFEDGTSRSFDEVVLCPPAPVAARLLRGLDAELSRELDAIPSAPLAVVALGMPEGALRHAPDGFGFLVPRAEGLRILGCLRESSIFPQRAPEGRVLLRVMIGGAHDPDAVELDDARLLEIVLGELRVTLGLVERPTFVRIVRHRVGIAQYEVGHGARLERIRHRLGRLPGLTVAGSSYHGVSLNACVERAYADAQTLARQWASSAADPPPSQRTSP